MEKLRPNSLKRCVRTTLINSPTKTAKIKNVVLLSITFTFRRSDADFFYFLLFSCVN